MYDFLTSKRSPVSPTANLTLCIFNKKNVLYRQLWFFYRIHSIDTEFTWHNLILKLSRNRKSSFPLPVHSSRSLISLSFVVTTRGWYTTRHTSRVGTVVGDSELWTSCTSISRSKTSTSLTLSPFNSLDECFRVCTSIVPVRSLSQGRWRDLFSKDTQNSSTYILFRELTRHSSVVTRTSQIYYPSTTRWLTNHRLDEEVTTELKLSRSEESESFRWI